MKTRGPASVWLFCLVVLLVVTDRPAAPRVTEWCFDPTDWSAWCPDGEFCGWEADGSGGRAYTPERQVHPIPIVPCGNMLVAGVKGPMESRER